MERKQLASGGEVFAHWINSSKLSHCRAEQFLVAFHGTTVGKISLWMAPQGFMTPSHAFIAIWYMRSRMVGV